MQIQGGMSANTILQMNITNTSTADQRLVLVSQDFITFKNITFQESDASLAHREFSVLVQLERQYISWRSYL